MYKDISWTNIDLIWTFLISMTMVDIKNYMVEEYIKIQHLCVIHVLCLDFYREFKNLTYYDFIWFCKILGIKHVSHITVFICWNLIYCTTMYSLMYKRIMEMRVSQMVSINLTFFNSLGGGPCWLSGLGLFGCAWDIFGIREYHNRQLSLRDIKL